LKAGGNGGVIPTGTSFGAQEPGEIRAHCFRKALAGGNRGVIQSKVGGNKGVIRRHSYRKYLPWRFLRRYSHPLSLSLSPLSTTSERASGRFAPLLIRTAGFTKLTARLKTRCAHRLAEARPTELSSDTKTPDDHRFLKATSGSLRSHKRTTSFTNTHYRLPLPRPTLGRGTPSPLYPRISRIKDPKEGNKREGIAGHNLPSECP
jgi:hypothetical protein